MNLGLAECLIILMILAIMAGSIVGVAAVMTWLVGAGKKRCPYCKSRIPKDATVCRYCRRDVAIEV